LKFSTFYLPLPFVKPKFFWSSWIILFCTFSLSFAQQKKKAGGPPPNTGDNAEISQSGDNNRFPTRQKATTKNNSLRVDKTAIKNKQKEVTKFQGKDIPDNKKFEHERRGQDAKGTQTAPTDQSSHPAQHQKAMENRERPKQEMHEYKGDVVVKKKSSLYGKDPSEINHEGRQSELVDHTKYKSYRDKAFDRKEATMEDLNSQGSAQYGLREESGLSLEKRKSMRQSKERERFEYSGDLLPKIDAPGATGNYEGDKVAVDREGNMKKRQEEMAEYSGTISAKSQEKKEDKIFDKEKEIANYSGDMNLEARDKMRREKQKEIAQNSGDIDMRAVIKREQEIRKKEKTISKYSGDILVKTLKDRDNKIRIKAKKIANWEGDIVIHKKRKGAHPSAAYRGGKLANSYKAREKYRKKMIKKYGRNPGIETPNYQKKKDDKPTYDKEESKIWDVQKYRESKTKE
jgi:hypothetical protein